MPKSQRIRTQVGVDKAIQVQLDQDFETLNILSLKILKSDIYNRQCSDYGVIVGRVFVNGGFGLPNARVSVFIPISTEDSLNPIITELYPYTSLSDLDVDGYRYNLLPKNPSYDGHAATGTFPDRSDALLDESYIEVYDKYYKFTTRTNDSGDYMIFGVPLGSQTIFMDADLSDIGCFSLSPQDLIQTGVAVESQVNGSKFKSSTNLNELPQIQTINKIVDISPLWGEPEICQLGITRIDFDLTADANIKIEPTAIFMGSIISTTEDDALRTNCKPKNNTGNLCELVAGPGQILSIRQTIDVDADGLPILEQFDLDNNGKVIDGDGSYLVNLPMNLDYVYTNEFGEQALSTDPTVGIPTKSRYRFKFKWENEGGLQNEFLRANYLVPNVKEHGWVDSNDYNTSDPLKTGTPSPISFPVPSLTTSDLQVVTGPGSLINPILTNVDSYQVFVSTTPPPALNLQPYLGNQTNGITGLTAISAILVTITPTDPTIPSSIFFTGTGGCPNTTFSIPGGPISFTSGPYPVGGGLVFNETINVSSYSVEINGTPYYGDVQVIPINAGDLVTITPIFTDPNTQATVVYEFYQQGYFDLLRSYSFSLDWDDYVDPQAAINCEDTFYEFHYNKVYTTAAFIDRYKNGVGRARHLGIKEIDNRSCKSTVNTFPVNDVIRNFDFLFFAFNLLLNILTIPILVLLFIAHLIALIWPILKWLLIALGLYFVVQAGYAVFEIATEIAAIFNELAGVFSYGAGFVFNLTNLLEALRLIGVVIVLVIKAIFIVGLSLAFLALAIFAALKVKGFPRIGLPMITYPDCSSCDCACGEAPMSDDFDSDSINNAIQEEGSANVDAPEQTGVPAIVSQQTSIFAPINVVSTYTVSHPNLDQPTESNGQTLRENGNFWLASGTGDNGGNQYRSFLNQAQEERLNGQLGVPAGLAFLRLAAGSESLEPVSIFSQKNIEGIPDKYRLHAPQPYLFATFKSSDGSSDGYRYLAHPISEAYSQKLNEFNYRRKYFDDVNKIKVTFNSSEPSNSGIFHYDQPLVILAKPGTLQNLGIGQLFTFQNPNMSQCNQNITGATFYNQETNQFGTNGVTGKTLSATTVQVDYAIGETSNGQVVYLLTNTGETESYLQYPIDIEYFQVITGYTYNQFSTNTTFDVSSDTDLFPYKYLRHKTVYTYADYDGSGTEFPDLQTNGIYLDTAVKQYKGLAVQSDGTANTNQNSVTILRANNYENYEIIVIARGVDPHSPKQKNTYDLSKIFGKTSFGYSDAIVDGEYYLNIPIKGVGVKPASHLIPNNETAPDLYFKTFNFELGESYVDISGITRNGFTGFTSMLPYYYSCIDESIANGYTPDTSVITFSPTSTLSSGQPYIGAGQRNKVLPFALSSTAGIPSNLINNYTSSYYFAGGSFTASDVSDVGSRMSLYLTGGETQAENDYWVTGSVPRRFSVYSPAYYRYSPTPINYSVNQTPGSDQYLVMRSDRIPTSTSVEELGYYTSFGLHQNNKFQVYKVGNEAGPIFGSAPDINAGQGVYDESELVQTLTSTLSCENMKSLQCYEGTGTSLQINQNCSVPNNRVYKGCYCLLNYKENDSKFFSKVYLIKDAYSDDARLFLEWKTRFVVTFAACRGVFAQVFQNNWINGALYMFTFNKSVTYTIDQPDQPIYNYCKDTMVFNSITNSFYYRSSPWDGNNFIGAPRVPNPNVPPFILNDYPGLGYNEKRIQFPTTIMDMGPREKFISEICSDGDFSGYLVDQIPSTSYKDNSDLIQMAFISRITSAPFRNNILPIGNPSGGGAEGKGIIQFFNSTRKGDRIDGDIAQALSINSEWKVVPYLGDNYADNDLFIGDSTAPNTPTFGIFFSSRTDDYQYRRKLTPGYEYYSLRCGGIFNDFGYPHDQIVPHYKWKITSSTTFIFGTENNNWDTTYATGGFYSNEYQNLNFDSPNQYFTTATNLNPGFITKRDANGDPDPYINTIPFVTNGGPNESVLVGAPFYFYFGLNNGFTAVDKFIKLYVQTTD
jgi:hypothetical protein